MLSDKRICAACVSDAYLKKQIKKSSVVNQKCDYCQKVRPTIDIGDLADRCNTVIDGFYEVSSLTNAVIHHRYTLEGETLMQVLDRIVSSQEKVIDDLTTLLKEMWFDHNIREHRYGEDPWFIEKTKFAAPLSDAWNEMLRSLKNEARFINPSAVRMLESVFGTIHDDKTHEGKIVVVEVGADCKIDTLYRARVFQTPEAMETALSHPERHIGPPPAGISEAGRMNAKGVTVFYGATKKPLAISEVRPPVGCHVVVGAFKLIRTLRLLDLQQLGSITLKPTSSPFDPITAKEASRRDFLKILTQKTVMPVMPELAEQDYLITQVIADFLSTHPKLELDGILFASAQNMTTPQDTSGRNVILFNKASTVLNAEVRFGDRTSVHLFEYDEDSPSGRLEPEIQTKECPTKEKKDCNAFMGIEQGQTKPALELDRNAIEIYEVSRVKYQTRCYPVKQHINASENTTSVQDFFS